MTALGTLLAGIKRRHCPETNTVNLTGLFEPLQPVPITPATNRTTNIFTQSPFEFSFIAQITKFLYNYQIYVFKMVQNFFNYFIYSLSQCLASLFLAIRAVTTPFNSFYNAFYVQPELVPCGTTGQSINARIKPTACFPERLGPVSISKEN